MVEICMNLVVGRIRMIEFFCFACEDFMGGMGLEWFTTECAGCSYGWDRLCTLKG